MSDQTGNTVLRAIRNHLGLTQRELGDQTGIDPTYVCQIETGARRIGHRKAHEIWTALRPACDRLGFTFEDLLGGGRGPVTTDPTISQNSSVGGNPDHVGD